MIRRSRAIANVCPSGTRAGKLEAAGFDGVEVFEADLLTFPGSPADVRGMAEELGLSRDLFPPFRDFGAMPGPQHVRNLDRAERKFDVMGQLGARLLLVCSNTQPAALDDPARVAADLHGMAGRAARCGRDDAALDALRRQHLLYDRDAGGELLHACAGASQDRFSEIAERRGSRGFGAPHATVRMAAQAAHATTGATWMD